MTLDLSAAHCGTFGRWVSEHYEIDRALTDNPILRCKRCHAAVGYLTKHAVVRHGDDITVRPIGTGKREADYAY
jgi:hypothetical protein